jgi:hypothetical protein
MSKPNLAQLLIDAAKANQKHQARTVKCPNCGGTVEISKQGEDIAPDDVTSETGNNDDVNTQQGQDAYSARIAEMAKKFLEADKSTTAEAELNASENKWKKLKEDFGR